MAETHPVVWFEVIGQDELPGWEGAGEGAVPPTKLPDTTIAVVSDPEGLPVGICA